jgi:acetyl esterase/lipase
VQDGALAVKWVHDNADRCGGDPDRIYLMGHSAGAHIAALLTLDPKYLKAVGLNRSVIRATAGLAGPYDFALDQYDRPAFGRRPNDPTPVPDMEPINFVDGHAPPMLLLQGLEDDTVNPNNAVLLADRIHQAGGEVQRIYYPNLGHEEIVVALAQPFRWLGPVLKDTVDFFNAHKN